MGRDQPVDALISSRIGDYVAVYQVLKDERQNGQLISATLVTAIHALLRHGPRSCNIRSGH